MAKEQETNRDEMDNTAQLEILKHDIKDIKNDVEELVNEVIKGNGRPSLKSRVTMIEQYIDKQEKLADEKRADNRKLKLLVAGAWISLIMTQVALKLFA